MVTATGLLGAARPGPTLPPAGSVTSGPRPGRAPTCSALAGFSTGRRAWSGLTGRGSRLSTVSSLTSWNSGGFFSSRCVYPNQPSKAGGGMAVVLAGISALADRPVFQETPLSPPSRQQAASWGRMAGRGAGRRGDPGQPRGPLGGSAPALWPWQLPALRHWGPSWRQGRFLPSQGGILSRRPWAKEGGCLDLCGR